MATRISKEIKTPEEQISAMASRISKEIKTPEEQISSMAVQISQQIKTPEARVNEDNLALNFVKICHIFLFRKKAIKRISQHREKGDTLILASASFDFYVLPIANFLKFDHVFSSKSCWSKRDKLIPEIDGPNLKGEFKLNAVKEIMGDRLNKNYTITYTDHISDLPLLKFAYQSYIINPNSYMKNIEKENGLSIVFW